MKYSDAMAKVPRLLISRDAEDYVATPTMLKDLVDNYGLRPLTQGKRMTVYDRLDIDEAITRKKLKEWK